MIGIAAAAVLGLAVVTLIWVRLAARQSERRSVRDYERALGALGGASRRTDRWQAARPGQPGRPEPGGAHVRPASELPPPRRPGDGPPLKARIDLGSRPPARRRGEPARSNGPRQAGDEAARNGTPAVAAAPSPTPRRPPAPPSGRPVPPVVPVTPSRRLYGPPVPEEAGLEPADPPTEVVEAAHQAAQHTLPPAELEQLVARSRRWRAGSGRAALRNTTGVRTAVPGTEVPPAPPAGEEDEHGTPGATSSGAEATATAATAGAATASPLGTAGAPEAAGGDAGELGSLEDDASAPIVFDFDELAEPPFPPTQLRPMRGLQPPGSRRTAMRFVTAAAAVVAAAALGAGVWLLATRTSPTHSAAPPAASHSRGGSSPAPGHRGHHTATTVPTAPAKTTAPPTTQASTTLTPVSTTPTLVVYKAPAAKYTLHFTVSAGECWVGAHNGATWTWQATVLPSTPADYAASGTTTIRIGAPSVLEVSADGKTVVLPKTVHPYDLQFTVTPQ